MESKLKSQQFLLVIDTDALMKQVPKPSLKQLAPTPLPDGVAYLVQEAGNQANGAFSMLDSGFVLHGHRGRMVYFRSISVTGNSSDAVLLYAVIPAKISRPGLAHLEVVTLDAAVEPDPNQIDGLPPQLTMHSFAAMKCFFLLDALTDVNLGIAVFQLDEGGEVQVPWGYFSLKIPVTIA